MQKHNARVKCKNYLFKACRDIVCSVKTIAHDQRIIYNDIFTS